MQEASVRVPGLVSLAEVVKNAADELREIRSNPPPDGQAVMQFTECEVEVEAIVGADVDGKVRFWVIEAGAGAKYENSHKVTLKFKSIGGPVQALSVPGGVADEPRGPPESN